MPSYTISLLIGFLFFLASILSFQVFNKIKLSLSLLVLAGFFLCLFAALLDPYLSIWDESFHALVAKNFLQHPLTPTLINNPLIDYDFANWTINHIWLHKQPLFLWQIAISLKLFGVNTLAVRIPSILMMSILPVFIYRIGKITINTKIGYYGAILFCSSYFMHQLVSGFFTNDHNDVAFLFYITASIWAWAEYQLTGKLYWVILIGLFSGCAILVKWLVGLLVFAGWGLASIFIKELRNKTNFKNILLSIIVCLIIVAPWQIYIHNTFPKESNYEYSYNAKHLTTVIEGHSGDALYYFKNLNELYGGGDWVPYAVIIALFFLFKSLNKTKYRIAFFTNIIIVYLLFTIASTKMIAFCFIVSPLVFLSLASMLETFLSFLEKKLFKKPILKNIFIPLLLLAVCAATLDANEILYRHSIFDTPQQKAIREERIEEQNFIKSLPTLLPSEDYVLFNCIHYYNIRIMFYTNINAYLEPLSYENYIALKSKNIKLATIDNGHLPDFILNDATIIKIPPPNNYWKE